MDLIDIGCISPHYSSSFDHFKYLSSVCMYYMRYSSPWFLCMLGVCLWVSLDDDLLVITVRLVLLWGSWDWLGCMVLVPSSPHSPLRKRYSHHVVGESGYLPSLEVLILDTLLLFQIVTGACPSVCLVGQLCWISTGAWVFNYQVTPKVCDGMSALVRVVSDHNAGCTMGVGECPLRIFPADWFTKLSQHIVVYRDLKLQPGGLSFVHMHVHIHWWLWDACSLVIYVQAEFIAWLSFLPTHPLGIGECTHSCFPLFPPLKCELPLGRSSRNLLLESNGRALCILG